MKTIIKLVSIITVILLTSCGSGRLVSNNPSPLNSREISSFLAQQGIIIDNLYLTSLSGIVCWIGHVKDSNLYFMVDLRGSQTTRFDKEPSWGNVPEDVLFDNVWYAIKDKKGIIIFIPQ